MSGGGIMSGLRNVCCLVSAQRKKNVCSLRWCALMNWMAARIYVRECWCEYVCVSSAFVTCGRVTELWLVLHLSLPLSFASVIIINQSPV